MKRRYRVTFTVDIELPKPFVDKDGKPDEQLLLKQAAFRVARDIGRHTQGRVTSSYEEIVQE